MKNQEKNPRNLRKIRQTISLKIVIFFFANLKKIVIFDMTNRIRRKFGTYTQKGRTFQKVKKKNNDFFQKKKTFL